MKCDTHTDYWCRSPRVIRLYTTYVPAHGVPLTARMRVSRWSMCREAKLLVTQLPMNKILIKSYMSLIIYSIAKNWETRWCVCTVCIHLKIELGWLIFNRGKIQDTWRGQPGHGHNGFLQVGTSFTSIQRHSPGEEELDPGSQDQELPLSGVNLAKGSPGRWVLGSRDCRA